MNIGKVVAITGPAACGKSTISKALQSRLSSQGSLWILVEVDGFASSLMKDWFSFDLQTAPYGDRGFTYTRGNDQGLQLAVGLEGRKVLNAFHRSVAAIARSGVDVVCETVICDDDDWADWLEVLQGIPQLWVELNAPLSVLETREIDRPKEIRGLARGMKTRGAVGQYDISADTSIETPEEIVDRILTSSDLLNA